MWCQCLLVPQGAGSKWSLVDSIPGSQIIQEILGRLFWFLLGQSVGINPRKILWILITTKWWNFQSFPFLLGQVWGKLMGLLGYTGSRVGQEWNGAGRWIHFWYHTGEKDRGEECSQLPAWQRGWKSWISPFCPHGCGACGDKQVFPVCPLPQDFRIWSTDLWAVQRHCSCFSQVLVCLLTFQFPSWTQMNLFGLISREVLPAISKFWIGISVSQCSVLRDFPLWELLLFSDQRESQWKVADW